ncbi:hypothetical protein C9439_00630 [archaeon SCG-AAA382B04]|nr:hypothetical protein C9439_00630 [archaeon SCG-AAA382B04]
MSEKMSKERQEIWNTIEELKPIINKEIRKVIPKNHEIDKLYDKVHYHLNTGGKRWRPALCLLICDAVNGEREKALPFAAAIEIIHNFSLIHDDIEDEDQYRRDELALWKKIGIPRAINVGDGMFAKGFYSASRSREVGLSFEKSFKLMKLLSKVVTELMEGQAMDINSRERNDISKSEYMKMISKKTGALVAGSVKGGAIIGGADDETKEAMSEFGKKIGPAFQITDDLLDFSESKGRRGMVGNDIREGKRSLMVIHYLETTSGEKRQNLLDILNKDREDTTQQDVEEAIGYLERNGSLEYAKNKKNQLAQEALESLNYLSGSEEKRQLKGMGRFLVERSF